ncbi:MAG: YjbQ family protein [Rhodospirillales bacterium]
MAPRQHQEGIELLTPGRGLVDIADDPRLYAHVVEGPDDRPAHIRSALTDVSLVIPIVRGRLGLERDRSIRSHFVTPN